VQQTNNAAGAAPAADKQPAPPTGIAKIVPLHDGLNATDVAAALQNKISGVTSLVPLGPSVLLYTIDPTKATGLPPTPAPKKGKSDPGAAANAVEAELLYVLHNLPSETMQTDVLPLPNGYLGACSVITMIGHQVPHVASLAALSDTRILAGFAGSDEDISVAKSKLKNLVMKLAVSSMPPGPHVQSVTMRLYYDRNAASVASAVGAAFSQLKVAPVSMNPANTYTDMIVLADPTGGASGETLSQARRMIAQLDEPRAQVVVNAWSLQVASDKQENTSKLVPEARRLAGAYNDALDAAVMRGWNYLNHPGPDLHDGKQIDYDPVFSGYLCRSFTYLTANVNDADANDARADGALGPKTWATERCPIQDSRFKDSDRLLYALGYDTLFGSEAPDLIQMMIRVMATTNPGAAIEATLNQMEGGDKLQEQSLNHPGIHLGVNDSCQNEDKVFYESQRKLIRPSNPQIDEEGFYGNIEQQSAPPYVGFACTRAELARTTSSSDGAVYTSSAVGQFRAAVADYLFQNKMKAEYANDFQPFLYPQSAATLDAVLTPIVDAFNEDLEALQQNLQSQLTEGVPQDKHLSYTSNGLISVKVVSGNQAVAQTQSLNYFPQNPTMKLEDFAAQLVAGANAATAALNANSKATQSTPEVPFLGGTLPTIIPAIAAFSAAQPQQVTAKVGSGLSLSVTPYTLSSARGAELSVNVTYNENAAATISSDATKSQANDDLNSRVSEHEVSTLVRMDSLKFFEVSTMQSVIARQRERYKLIDPIVELPILDGLAFGARRKPEVIYNQSIIFMEASIMPTAADLGQGLVYHPDTVEEMPAKKLVEARSRENFGTWAGVEDNALDAIMNYHRHMVAYFAGEYIDSSGFVHSPAFISLSQSLSPETYASAP
jgi:hypothetical protein